MKIKTYDFKYENRVLPLNLLITKKMFDLILDVANIAPNENCRYHTPC